MLVNFYEKNSQHLNLLRGPALRDGAAVRGLREQRLSRDAAGHLLPHGRSHTDMLHSVEAAVKQGRGPGLCRSEARRPARPQLQRSGIARTSRRNRRCSRRYERRGRGGSHLRLQPALEGRGTNQHRYDTYGQGRFAANPFDNLALFEDQSAVFNAKSMNTPLLILQGTVDGSTEWLQGDGVLQRAPLPEEAGDLSLVRRRRPRLPRYDNQFDVEVRMQQFFDHYLKGARGRLDGEGQFRSSRSRGRPVRRRRPCSSWAAARGSERRRPRVVPAAEVAALLASRRQDAQPVALSPRSTRDGRPTGRPSFFCRLRAVVLCRKVLTVWLNQPV